MFGLLTYRKRDLGATLPFLRAISQVDLMTSLLAFPPAPEELVVVVTVVVVQVTPGYSLNKQNYEVIYSEIQDCFKLTGGAQALAAATIKAEISKNFIFACFV